jgi:hypothetical protein
MLTFWIAGSTGRSLPAANDKSEANERPQWSRKHALRCNIDDRLRSTQSGPLTKQQVLFKLSNTNTKQ